jgi:prevent-host-death family protein
MHTVRASDAKNKFGELVDRAQREPVRIERHGRGVAVIISEADYAELEAMKLEALRAAIDRGRADHLAGRVATSEAVFAKVFDAIDER